MSSKTMKRFILILVVLLLCALGGYLIADTVMKQKEKAIAEEQASLHLFHFDPNAVESVTLDGKDGFFRFTFQDADWKITETDYTRDITINPAYLSTVCSYMSELTALTKFESSPEKLADYGLDDPVTLTCHIGDTEHTLYIGNPTPTNEYFYAKLPDNETVFGLDFTHGSILYGDILMIKSSWMLNYFENEICEIRLERDKKLVYDLKRDTLWTMLAPIEGGNIDSAMVDSMLTNLVRFELDSYVDIRNENHDLSKYGLDDIYATLRVNDINGKETIIDFAHSDPNNGVVYLYYRNENEIATITQNQSNFLNTQLKELMRDEVMKMDYYTTASVDAVVDDIAFRMEMDEANGIRTLDGVDITALGAEAITTFRALYDTMSNLAFEDLLPDEQVDVTAEPAATFRYTMQDGTVSELALIPADDEELTYYALIDGEYSGMTVRRRELSGTSGVLTFHERMMDFLADSQSAES